MKKGYSLMLLLLCCTWASAQNWAPINTTDKFNYKLDTASAISHTLWVDSVQVVGGDTVYWMNRIVKPISDTIALKNQPQFLLKQVRIKSIGGYSFDLPNHIGYNPSAVLGDSMLYDTTANITAKVIALDASIILGNTDSTKTLLLSSGDTVVVSKSYGFVQYPDGYTSHKYYRLAGIEGGRNLGEHVARFHDFFDFQVGDEFEYYTTASNADGNCWRDSSVITLLHRDTMNHTLVDSFKRFAAQYPICNSSTPIEVIIHFAGNYTLTDSVNSDVNMWPNTISPIDHIIITYVNDSFFQQIFYNYFDIRTGTAGQFTNTIGCGSQFPNHPFTNRYYIGVRSYRDHNHVVKIFDVFYEQDSSQADTLFARINNDIGFYNSRVFKTDLGLTDYYGSGCFEQTSEGHLIAYQKASDSLGVIDSFIMGINEVVLQQINCTIRPNPISTQLNIQLPEATNAIIRLLDINGSEVLVQQATDSHATISTSSLPAGMYIVEVCTKDGVGRRKVVKM